MAINSLFVGNHYDWVIADDVVEASPLTEEVFHEWLREAFAVTRQNLTNSGMRATASEVIQREQSKKLARLLISEQRVKKQALKLLRRFITPAQWQDYNSSGCFSQKDGKGRTWKFKKEHHYPIECDGTPICIDAERGAPDEDLLLQVWLEVIGGRGQELLPSGETWLEGDVFTIQYSMIPLLHQSVTILYGIT